jgi:hypothetical protein
MSVSFNSLSDVVSSKKSLDLEVSLVAVIFPGLESNSKNPLADDLINAKRAAVVDHSVAFMKNFACVGHQKARDRRVSVALRD